MTAWVNKLKGAAGLKSLAAALLLALPALSPLPAGAADVTLGPGETSVGTQRKVVFVPTWGYWVFYNDDAGEPAWTYSPSGSGGSWTAPAKVLDGSGALDYAGQPSVWYNAVSSYVFVGVGPASNGELSNADKKIHLRKGQLDEYGGITWLSYRDPDFDEGTRTANDDEDMVNEANAAAGLTLAQNNNGYVWAATLGGEGSVGGFDDYISLIGVSNSLNGVDIADGHREVGGSMEDDALISWSLVLPHGGAADQVWAFTGSGSSKDIYLSRINEAYTQVSIGNFFSNAMSATVDDSRNVSGVTDSAGRLHAVASWSVDGTVRYNTCTSGNVIGAAVSIAAGYTAKQVSVSIIYYPATSQARLYVVLENGAGELYYVESALFTPGNAAASWGAPTLLRSDGTKPVVAYSVVSPYPLAIVYTNSLGNVIFTRVPTSTNGDPTVTSINPKTVGIGAGIEDAIVDTSYDITLTGTNLFNNPTPSLSFERNGEPLDGVTVTSMTPIGVTSVTVSVHFTVDQSVSAGPMDMRVINYDAREVLKVGIATVTVPSSELTYPVEPISYSSGIASITGTASFAPAAGQASIAPQVRVTLLSGAQAGFQWNGADAYIDPGVYGQQWIQVTGGVASWTHTGWYNDAVAQASGQTFQIESRGRTNDRGFGSPSNPVVFTVDKTPSDGNFSFPEANSSKKSIPYIQGKSTDTASGIKYIEMQLRDSVDNVFDLNDQYWTGFTATGFQAAATWYYMVKIPSPPGEITKFSCGTECTYKNIDTIVKSVPDNVLHAKLPTFTDGRKYRIAQRQGDYFSQGSASSNREFYYDLSAPTVTVTSPSPLMDPMDYPEGPVSLADPANVWKNSVTLLEGAITDNVVDPVIGKRWVRYCVYEQGGGTKWGSACASPAPTFASAQYAPAGDPFGYSIAISTNWQDGYWYSVALYAEDAAGNSTQPAIPPAPRSPLPPAATSTTTAPPLPTRSSSP